MAQFFGFKILRVFPSTLTNTYIVEMVLLWQRRYLNGILGYRD
jgi:hypothetical protein